LNNIIFIGGIHGVGKGTICRQISDKFSITHITASEVLKWDEISNNNNKLVENFSFTQNRLINNLKSIVSNEKNYLLDGHYCLLNSEIIPERIDRETFSILNPQAFIIVIDDVEKIISRLGKRDNNQYDFGMLSEFQQMELDYAKELSTELGKPLLIVQNGNFDLIINFFKNENIT